MSDQECRSCHAPIMFIPSMRGALIPLDAQPVPNGNVVIIDGRANVIGPGDLLGELWAGLPHYLSHFTTCPDADQWRKPTG